MKHIQWFPGHMTKAMRMMEDNVKLVDGVIMILDARAPFACINKKLDGLFVNRPVLYVLNKADLVNMSDTDRVIKEFAKDGRQAVACTGVDKKAVTLLYNKIFSMLRFKLEKNKERGYFKPLRIMVAGIPNTGKSTIINSLCGSKKTVTGDKAGVTRGKQWVRLRELDLLDTPGTMPPSFENQTYAKHLAYLGSINDEILDFEELTEEFVMELAQTHPEVMTQKYGITEFDKTYEEYRELICRKRGYIIKGGEIDTERFSKAVIDDFRKGRLGKICLE